MSAVQLRSLLAQYRENAISASAPPRAQFRLGQLEGRSGFRFERLDIADMRSGKTKTHRG